MKTHTKSNNL